MANFDYAQARLTAAKIISKFGAPGEFYLDGDGGYDDFGDPLPSQPNTEYTGTVSPLLGYKAHEIDGEQIQSTDSFVFFRSDTVPEIGSTSMLNGEVYRVVNVKRLDSVGGINVYAKLQLRR